MNIAVVIGFYLLLPVLGLSQPDYILPLDKPAKYRYRTLGSEKTEDKKFTISRRLYQGMVTHYNYYYNANLKIENIVARAKGAHQDDYTALLPFYNYDPARIAATDSVELDSIVYKASAGIVLHDLRNSYIDNLYLLAGRAFFYWQKYDSAYRIFQFMNYRFFPKGKDEYLIVVGGNKRSQNGQLNISNQEKKGWWRSILSRPPSRNDALLWMAKTYAADSLLSEATAMCHLLKKDKFFPPRLQRSLDEVLAYVYYRREQWDSTAYYLQRALPNASNKSDLARWEYLLGQLKTKLNKPLDAAMYFAKAKKHTPDPVLHIYARIYEAQQVNLPNAGDDIEQLMQLARKERFDGFEDVLFFAAAGIAIEKKDTSRGIELLLKSAQYNKENTELKNKIYLKLATLYDRRKAYPLAAAAYDSLNLQASLPAPYKAAELEERRTQLKGLCTQISIVHREDSLQTIARMPEEDRMQYLKKLLKALRKAKGLKEIDTDSYAGNAGLMTSGNQPPDLFIQTSAGGGWYFNNNTQKSKGFTEFNSRWGKRPNEDNWRRQSTLDANANRNNFSPGNPGGIEGDVDQVPNPVNPSLTRSSQSRDEQDISLATLEDDLPLTDTLLILSNEKILAALLQQVWIYKNQLEDYAEAIRVLEIIQKRFPLNPKNESVLFDLMYCYKKTGNANVSRNYFDQLASAYPESDELKAAKGIKTDSAAIQKADRTPQLLYIKAMEYLKAGADSLALNVLNEIETKFPQSPVVNKATTLKEVIQKRVATENYLCETPIERLEDPRLPIPYDDLPEINVLRQPVIISSTLNNFLNYQKLPTQKIPLEKQRTGISWVTHERVSRSFSNMAVNFPKADTTRRVLMPAKEEKIDMVYFYNATEPYVLLLLFENVDPTYRSEAKIAFQRYNGSRHGAEDIGHRLFESKEGFNFLELGPFPAMASCLGYYDEVSADMKNIIPWLKRDSYRSFIISEKNLEIFKERKDISEYLLFIRQHIKGKF